MGWFGNLGKSLVGGAKKLWGSVGGVKGLTKKLGQVSSVAKKVGDVTKSATPMIQKVLGKKLTGQLQGGIEGAGRLAGQGKRGVQLAEDTAEDIGNLRKAYTTRDLEKAYKAGKRAYGRGKGAKRFIKG